MVACIQRHVPAGTLRLVRPAGGLYLWCRLAAGLSASALYERALAAGVAFVPGSAFYPDPAGDSELRLCFSGVTSETADEAITRLGACIAELGRPRGVAPGDDPRVAREKRAGDRADRSRLAHLG